MKLLCLVLLAAFAAMVANGDACTDQYLLTGTSPSKVLSTAAINSLLVEHNRARLGVSPQAKTMPMLQWNQVLADFAQEYMDTCVGMVHSSNAMRSNASRFGWSYVGENLAAGSGSTYLALTGGFYSAKAWNDEVTDWTYPSTCASGKACGHYTQNIWAATTHVGCGYARCESLTFKNYWSCVYGPGGNYRGVAPYDNDVSGGAASCTGTGVPAPVIPTAAPTTAAASNAATTVAATNAATAVSARSVDCIVLFLSLFLF
jgi:uncharacterized protein YkwD